jgi:hypothetical protein
LCTWTGESVDHVVVPVYVPCHEPPSLVMDRVPEEDDVVRHLLAALALGLVAPLPTSAPTHRSRTSSTVR